MTRTGTKWITMAIVLLLAAGAWAEPKQGRARKQPDRRSESRSKVERERNEREERAERNRDRDRDEHRRRKPEVRIFRFEHVPAQSFLGVLEQLSRKSPLGELMSKVPIAMHENSYAVVIIAPRQAMELFEQIAEGIDEPSEFNKRMAQKRGPGAPNRPGA